MSDFLRRLETGHQIGHQKNNITTVIRIINYDAYQNSDTKKSTKRTPKGHQKDTNNKYKYNSNKINTYKDTMRDFEEFWRLYPMRDGKKIGKKRTSELFAKVKDKDLPDLRRALENYASSGAVKRGYARDPERFLKADYWRDWIEPEIKDSKTAEQKDNIQRLNEFMQGAQDEQRAIR